jgi:energy-coupling factor transporter transmembrane protein EcfT
MQDPRLRLFSVTILSAATFLSIQGALLSLLWLFLYPAYLKEAVRSSGFWFLMLITATVSGITILSGGEGISYFVRISVIFLMAFTIYRGWKPGEYLDLSVWLFGTRWGFELGLVIEMTMQGLKDGSRDWSRMLAAQQLKATRPGFRNLPVLGFLLVQIRLMRAQDQADLLLLRGYDHGGSCCPEFHTDTKDSIASILAFFFFILALFPVRDVFILQM